MKFIFADPNLMQTAQFLLIALGSIFFGFLGYKLFMYGIETGLSKVKTPSKAQKIFYSGIGPGSLLMAMGVVGLLVALVVAIPDSTSAEKSVVVDTGKSSQKGDAKNKSVDEAATNDFVKKNTIMFAVLCIILIALLIYLNYKLPRKQAPDPGFSSQIVSKAKRIEYLERLIEMNAFQLQENVEKLKGIIADVKHEEASEEQIENPLKQNFYE